MFSCSKSKYKYFVKCPRAYWLKINHPELEKVTDSQESRQNVGNKFGDLAMGYFGAFTEVTTVKDDGGLDYSAMIAKTEECLKNGTETICEASFSYQGLFCSVDILHKEKNGYALYEVKSSTSVKDEHYIDIAFQKYVLDKLGINVVGTYCVIANNEYVKNGDIDINQLLKVVDVSAEIVKPYSEIDGNLVEIKKLYDSKTEPCGLCSECKDCGFFKHCVIGSGYAFLFDLYSLNKKQRANYLSKADFKIEELYNDTSVTKNKIRKLQLDCIKNNVDEIIDKNGINDFLNTLSYPLYFLDFETVASVIPIYNGTRPYQKVPFQYSLHYIESEGGELKHTEFLGYPSHNPSRDLAEKLCKDIPENVCVLAYNMPFEKGVLQDLANLYPDLSDKLLNIRANVKDLIVPFKEGYYYNRAMYGSFSIKDVLPALCPDYKDSYKSLEGVHNGNEAIDTFIDMLDLTKSEIETARHYLLEYCELDTLAMVKIWGKLKIVAMLEKEYRDSIKADGPFDAYHVIDESIKSLTLYDYNKKLYYNIVKDDKIIAKAYSYLDRIAESDMKKTLDCVCSYACNHICSRCDSINISPEIIGLYLPEYESLSIQEVKEKIQARFNDHYDYDDEIFDIADQKLEMKDEPLPEPINPKTSTEVCMVFSKARKLISQIDDAEYEDVFGRCLEWAYKGAKECFDMDTIVEFDFSSQN